MNLKGIFSWFADIDWFLFAAALLISLAGLVTMNSFTGNDRFFERQVVWLIVSSGVFFVFSVIDWRFLRKTWVVVSLYVTFAVILMLLFVVGHVSHGAQLWLRVGALGFQPSDPVKLVIIIILAKYFTRRHVEIAHVRHIIVSGLYAAIMAVLVLLQPDFGSTVIIFCLWLGMVLISGISKKHLAAVFALGLIAFGCLWFYVLQPFQKQRIETFVNPLADVQGAGYHSQQSMIAVGSGQIFGKGIGYGTQSKLRFLPEYQTDFIFASFAEEWGFVGVVLLIAAFSLLIWRILKTAMYGSTNFEILFGAGIAILFITQFMIHVGMNIGLLPVTGKTLPFMSYGGSHLLTEFAALGILMGMRRYRRAVHKSKEENEMVGIA